MNRITQFEIYTDDPDTVRLAALCTVAVSSLDQTIKDIEQHGGKICVTKIAIPKVGWPAYAADPAGNVLGMQSIAAPNTRSENLA